CAALLRATLPERVARFARIGGAAAIALLLPAVVVWPPQRWLGQALGTACAVSFLIGALPALHLAQRGLDEFHPSLHGIMEGRQRRKRLLQAALSAAPIWTPLVFAESVTLVFALEWTSGLGGFGPRTIDALHGGEMPWLMAVCLSLGAL